MRRIEDYLLQHATTAGDRLAVVCGSEHITYARLCTLVQERARTLAGCGQKGLVLRSSQSIDFLVGSHGRQGDCSFGKRHSGNPFLRDRVCGCRKSHPRRHCRYPVHHRHYRKPEGSDAEPYCHLGQCREFDRCPGFRVLTRM